MGKEKNANGEGYILNLWKKYGETKARHTHQHYQCRIMCSELDDTGKRHYVYANADDKEQARKLCKQKASAFDYQQRQKRSSTFITSPINSTDTFSQSALLFMDYIASERQWSGNTKLSRVSDMKGIIKKIGNYKIKDITQEVLILTFNDLLKKHSRQTVGSQHSLLTDYFNYLIDASIVSVNPMTNVRLPKKKKAQTLKMEQVKKGKKLKQKSDKLFDDMEIKKLISQTDLNLYTIEDYADTNQFPKQRRDTYYLLIFTCLYLTGMRGQEIRALTVEDIDFSENTITINKSLSLDEENGKSVTVLKEAKTEHSTRTIKISAQTADYFKELIRFRPVEESSFLVQNKKGNWISKRYFITLFDKVLTLCGIPKNSRGVHSLRHTFVSFSIEKNSLSPLSNATPLFISAYVGHSTLDFTERIYTKLSGNKLKDVSRFNVLDFDPIEINNE